ncbi:MAG: hypothetical protein QNJ64_20485, partial [Crocosphaera sp.]|nr:hypothetical protein [Crocosphaera sp.]
WGKPCRGMFRNRTLYCLIPNDGYFRRTVSIPQLPNYQIIGRSHYPVHTPIWHPCLRPDSDVRSLLISA